jgi:ribose/xylose/arabinose/galactoside ABC-type transport system permease subunit
VEFEANKSLFSIKKIQNLLLSYGIYFMVLMIVIFFSIRSSAFLTSSNIIGMLQNANALMVISAGLTFVILIGALDLSVGSVAYVVAALSMLLINHGVSIGLSLIIGLICGTFIGFINATLIILLKMNPMLITLGMMIGLRGVALQLTQAKQIYIPESLENMGIITIGAIPLILLFVFCLIFFAQILLTKTTFGRHLIATGCNGKGAEKVGINTVLVKYFVFIISGTFAGLGGIVSMINMGAVLPSMGKGMEFTAVAAVVLGGTSLFGGKGSFLPGTIFGVLILAIIENGLNILGVSPFLYPFAQGLIIFIAMYADSLKHKRILE